MELFDLPLTEEAIKLISENTEIVNENIAGWIKSEKSIQSGIAERVLLMLTLAKRRNDLGQKSLKVTKERKTLIEHWVRSGYEMRHFIGVVDFKIKEWKGTSFEQNITPETLFSKKYFLKYLEAARDARDDKKEKKKEAHQERNQYEELLK